MISQRHTIPQQRPITWLVCLSVPIFAYDVLYGIEFWSAVICIYDYLSSSHFALFISVHNMVLIYTAVVLDVLIVVATYLIQIINSLPKIIYHYLIINCSIIIVILSWSRFLFLLWSFISLGLCRTRNFITLNVLLLLYLLLLILLIRRARILSRSSFILNITLISFARLILILFNLITLILQSNTIIIQNNLFFRSSGIVILILIFWILTQSLLRWWLLVSWFAYLLLIHLVSYFSIVMFNFYFFQTFIWDSSFIGSLFWFSWFTTFVWILLSYPVWIIL